MSFIIVCIIYYNKSPAVSAKKASLENFKKHVTDFKQGTISPDFYFEEAK